MGKNQISALPRYYAAYSGNSLPTFWNRSNLLRCGCLVSRLGKNVANYELRSIHFLLCPATINCHKGEMASGCTSVCPSIRIYQHGLHLTDTRAPFKVRNFVNICQKNSNLVTIVQNSVHFHMKTKVSFIFAVNALSSREVI